LSGGGGIWQRPPLQRCPSGQGWLLATQEPALQVLVARVVSLAHAVPQSLPSAAGSQPEPSARHLPLLQAPLQASAVQQTPATQPSPLRHCPLLPPHGSPGPRAVGSHPPVAGLQMVPAAHCTGEHLKAVPASHCWQRPGQAWSQQWPATQAPDLQSPLATHAPPGSCPTPTHRLP
jgi:hypothetical protein